MFVPFDQGGVVHVGLVALGTPPRLQECLDSLVAHESRHDFVVSCLVNPVTVTDAPLTVEVPEGVRVERPAANLGWAGGLHRLRALTESTYFGWAQDDMKPEPGWLDALVDAAEAHPGVAAFGAVGVSDDDERRVLLHNGGMALPPDDVSRWSHTDRTPSALPSEVTVLDWVTSKGCLTPTAAFDEVGGPDPRLWPLNRGDLDYSTHLRCHGWDVALVPSARVRHGASLSAPSALRTFLLEWRDAWFDERWAAAVTALVGRSSAIVDHPCQDWRENVPADADADAVAAVVGREATMMLVPFARASARAADLARARQAELEAELAEHGAVVRVLGEQVAGLTDQLARERETDRHRRRRLRRQLRRTRRRLAAIEGSWTWRATAPLRRRAARK